MITHGTFWNAVAAVAGHKTNHYCLAIDATAGPGNGMAGCGCTHVPNEEVHCQVLCIGRCVNSDLHVVQERASASSDYWVTLGGGKVASSAACARAAGVGRAVTLSKPCSISEKIRHT
eukprot:888119-Amphidinium_carterae.1